MSRNGRTLLGVAVLVMLIATSAVATTLDVEKYQRANVDWQQFAGQRLLIAMNKHGWTDGIEKILPEFEKLTQIKVTLDVYSEEEFRKKRLVALAAGGGIFDMVMMDQALVQYVDAGWLEPWDTYLNDPKLVDPEWYDYQDIFSSGIGHGSYKGKLYGMPITTEAQILFYRKDLYQKKGLIVPTTMDELYEAAVKLKTAQMSGIANRGHRGWGANVWSWTGYCYTYGGKIFDEQGRPVFNSPEAIAATEMYAKLLRDAGPKGAVNYNWYEIMIDFQQGKTAMITDSSGFTAPFEDPTKSVAAGKVGYAMLPRVPGKPLKADYWHWMLSLAADSLHKGEATLFLAWATGSPGSRYTGLVEGYSARESIWKSEDFRSKFPADFSRATLQTILEADPIVQAWHHPKFPEIGEELSIAISNAIAGTQSAQEALDKAVKKAERILQR